MSDQIKISDSELEILGILWSKGKLSANEIIRMLQLKKEWSNKTIRTLIDRLVLKEAVAVDRSSKEMLFTPLIQREEYESMTRISLADKLYEGSVSKLLLNFVKESKLNQSEVNELKKILEEMGK